MTKNKKKLAILIICALILSFTVIELRIKTCILGHDWEIILQEIDGYEYYNGKYYLDQVCMKCGKIDLSYTNNRKWIEEAKEKEKNARRKRNNEANKIFNERVGGTK